MNTKIAAGLFAFTLMFAGSAKAETLSSGLYRVHEAVVPGELTIIMAIVEVKGADGQGDSICTIERAAPNGKASGEYLFAESSNAGTAVNWSKTNSPTKWILHKNSTGWSVIHSENGANTVAATEKNGRYFELQRNQGQKHQLWHFEKSK